METNGVNPNNTPKTTSTAETEAYFNSLLKSQEQSANSDKIRVAKLVSLAVLIAIVGAGLYLAVGLFINSNNAGSSGSSTATGENENTGAYFNPEYYTNRSRNISGRVGKNFSSSADPMMQFELSENNGTTIAYLFSQNLDLDLSVGLQVEIQGELKSTTVDGKEIIEVRSIKLK